MKLNVLVVTVLPAALALPATREAHVSVSARQSIETITDQLLFEDTLPEFTAHRNAKDPSTLDWTSDGCTSSPDNPFGFPFVPACNRHDFGYTNYRAQSRFTVSAKAKIDTNFKTEYVSPSYVFLVYSELSFPWQFGEIDGLGKLDLDEYPNYLL